MNNIEAIGRYTIQDLAEQRIDLQKPNKYQITTKHVGSFCEIYMVSAKSGNLEQKFIMRIFGRNKMYEIDELRTIRDQIMQYQAQLNSSNVLFPQYSQKNDIQILELENQNVIVAYEPWFGDTSNHFDLIDAIDIDNHTKFRNIISDLNLLITLSSDQKVGLLNKTFQLLKVGIDSKPDNFTTHQGTTVYIDLYPPLPILQDKRIHHHPKLTAPHKMDAVTYMMGTLEGVILRYLKSAEYRLSNPDNIKQFYDDILLYLKPLIDDMVYQYIYSQIKIYQFDDLNQAYKVLLK